MLIPKLNWIPFNKYNPPKNLNEKDYLVFIRSDGLYHVDVATPYGYYLDDFWDTSNDWREGQPIKVLAYAEIPEQLCDSELVEEG